MENEIPLYFCPIRSKHDERQRIALTDWLMDFQFDGFITLTFHQARQNFAGGPEFLRPETVGATVNHVMARLLRSTCGNCAVKQKKWLTYATFIEWSLNEKLHAHIPFRLPPSTSLQHVDEWLEENISKVTWLREIFDVRPAWDVKGLLEYCLLDGAASFSPEATKLPTF